MKMDEVTKDDETRRDLKKAPMICYRYREEGHYQNTCRMTTVHCKHCDHPSHATKACNRKNKGKKDEAMNEDGKKEGISDKTKETPKLKMKKNVPKKTLKDKQQADLKEKIKRAKMQKNKVTSVIRALCKDSSDDSD